MYSCQLVDACIRFPSGVSTNVRKRTSCSPLSWNSDMWTVKCSQRSQVPIGQVKPGTVKVCTVVS
jgi:hypothetical protein